MMMDNRDEYIKYRFKRAKESFDEALILAENHRWNAVVNRLYYSCFYAVIALMLKNNIEVHTHDGARTKFGKYFIKTGEIDKQQGKLFTKMFDYRQKGDYGDLFDYDELTVIPLINQVREFISELEKIINK
jgi:hypothetical protein